MREKIIKLLIEVCEDYMDRGVVIQSDFNHGHDIHAFYRLKDGNRVVHVQGYPGMSTEGEARIFARMMDYKRMMEIRKAGGVSIGNEHDAVIKPFPNFNGGVFIPYRFRVLESMLGENVPELSNP